LHLDVLTATALTGTSHTGDEGSLRLRRDPGG
jgi:hypothetical protein